MRRVLIGACAIILMATAHANAASDFKILELRNKFFEESKQVKDLLGPSKDPAVLVSMYNSCVLSITQLDAYFGLLGIFETMSSQQVTTDAVDVITNWLYEIKRTNALNISTLDGMLKLDLATETKNHLAKLKSYYAESSMRVDAELSKLNAIRKTSRSSLVAAPQAGPAAGTKVAPKAKK